MDNTEKPFTVLEWCAGYGGIGMGLKRVIRNLRTIAYSEIELFGCEILASRMEAGQIDAAPIWTNLKTFPCERFRGMVDLLVAGYPCQPFSSAGKRKGEEDPRHLWPFIERAISDVRPNWVFCERWVEALMGLPIGWTDPTCSRPITPWEAVFTAASMNSEPSETE